MNDYQRVARVIRYLDEHHDQQPNLATLAAQAELSSYHFHRLFARWAAVTPKDFLQCLTLEHARRLLHEGESVLQAALAAGLSGPGRLHDLCVTLQAASPGEIKSGGAAWTTRAGMADSPFGMCLVAESPRGICHLSFLDAPDRQAGAAAIRRDWPQTRIEWNDTLAERLCHQMFAPATDGAWQQPLRAHVRGTRFQLRVWRALLTIPPGALTTYGRLAAAAGNSAAARAAGTAVAANPLAYLIPCHRVIRQTGVLGPYRWDPARKKALIAWESARQQSAAGGQDSLWQRTERAPAPTPCP